LQSGSSSMLERESNILTWFWKFCTWGLTKEEALGFGELIIVGLAEKEDHLDKVQQHDQEKN
jgi:hypothetical protein